MPFTNKPYWPSCARRIAAAFLRAHPSGRDGGRAGKQQWAKAPPSLEVWTPPPAIHPLEGHPNKITSQLKNPIFGFFRNALLSTVCPKTLRTRWKEEKVQRRSNCLHWVSLHPNVPLPHPLFPPFFFVVFTQLKCMYFPPQIRLLALGTCLMAFDRPRPEHDRDVGAPLGQLIAPVGEGGERRHDEERTLGRTQFQGEVGENDNMLLLIHAQK